MMRVARDAVRKHCSSTRTDQKTNTGIRNAVVHRMISDDAFVQPCTMVCRALVKELWQSVVQSDLSRSGFRPGLLADTTPWKAGQFATVVLRAFEQASLTPPYLLPFCHSAQLLCLARRWIGL